MTLHSRFSCRCKSYIRLSVSISLVCTLIKSSVGDKSPSLDEPGYHRVTLILTPGHDRPVTGEGKVARLGRLKKKGDDRDGNFCSGNINLIIATCRPYPMDLSVFSPLVKDRDIWRRNRQNRLNYWEQCRLFRLVTGWPHAFPIRKQVMRPVMWKSWTSNLLTIQMYVIFMYNAQTWF